MITYNKVGVNKEEGYKTIAKINKAVSKTHNSKTLMGLGNFGSFYKIDTSYKSPVLVSGTDGVGTKILIALHTKVYNTIGQDCFAMCANDILCHGAKPLFFLDYLSCGKLDSKIASSIINGLAETCYQYNTALIGGETAELADIIKRDDYDLAGFCVGIVENRKIITGKKIKEGDVIIGLPSSGLHSNGFSLVRKVFKDLYETYEKKPIYKTLLTPTRVYVQSILSLIKQENVKGLAHITGGGLIENIPRILSDNLCAEIDTSKITVLNIFKEIQKRADILDKEMWGTFNMGIGLVLVVSSQKVKTIMNILEKQGENPAIIGKIIKNSTKKIVLL